MHNDGDNPDLEKAETGFDKTLKDLKKAEHEQNQIASTTFRVEVAGRRRSMKSWALLIVLVLGCPFSPVAAEDKAEAPKVEVKQQQKRLALFLDGTWNEVESNTNVWRMKALCAPTSTDGKSQLAYYEIDVNGVVGGSTGKGLDANIKRAYEWLIENYSEGD